MTSGQSFVFRGARVVDGTGNPAITADVSVHGDRIAEVGAAGTLDAAEVIDAEGLLLTPGFVDVHTHYDAQVTWDPWVTPSSWHGVTTAIMGNCGVGFAPAEPSKHDWLIQLMEGVEDIPGSALAEGISWGWESFEEYLDVVASTPRVIDVGAQIAHGPLRAYVMGDRASSHDPAPDSDIAEMAQTVERALRAGAFGFSTSRTSLHRAKDGELVPGTFADERELMAIGEAIKRAGHGVFQFAPEHARVAVEEWPWMRRLAAVTGQPVSVNLSQPDTMPDLWRTVLQQLDEAHADGLPLYAQVAGRSIGILYCLEGSVHPLMFHPAYHEIMFLPFEERLTALREPERRRRFIEELPDDGGFMQKAVFDKLDGMWPTADGNIDYEPDRADSVAGIARRTGTPAMAIILDQLLSNDGHGMLYAPFFNYGYGDLGFTATAHQHPHTRMGLSDAGAHCGAICDGGMPTFMLTHWTRDRTRGERLALEHVVHRQTQQTAQFYGLHDRGVIAPGMRADLNLIDYESLTFGPARMAFDLPAGGRRLVQKASGYVGTWVGGVRTVQHDNFTGELPGTLLRATAAR